VPDAEDDCPLESGQGNGCPELPNNNAANNGSNNAANNGSNNAANNGSNNGANNGSNNGLSNNGTNGDDLGVHSEHEEGCACASVTRPAGQARYLFMAVVALGLCLLRRRRLATDAQAQVRYLRW